MPITQPDCFHFRGSIPLRRHVLEKQSAYCNLAAPTAALNPCLYRPPAIVAHLSYVKNPFHLLSHPKLSNGGHNSAKAPPWRSGKGYGAGSLLIISKAEGDKPGPVHTSFTALSPSVIPSLIKFAYR